MVEAGPVDAIFERPRMPYTAALLASVPRLGRATRGQRLPSIPGQAPTLTDLPPGCRFSNRCAPADAGCRAGQVVLDAATPGHDVRCVRWHHLDLAVGTPA